jgi:transketolase
MKVKTTIAKLKNRILKIKYLQGENHIGSCLSAVPIIKEIYDQMRLQDRFILSSGHAGVALYAVLESKGILPRSEILKLESHPVRNKKYKIWATTGSLGHGIGIAVGMALNQKREVYCLLSDGEMAEGSVWEVLTIASKLMLYNLHIYINCNGWAGLEETDMFTLEERTSNFNLDIDIRETDSNFYHKGLDAHYKSLTKKEYEKSLF